MKRSKILLITAVISLVVAFYFYRDYSNFSSIKPTNVHFENRIEKYSIQGIDVSHHQGVIEWDKVTYPNPERSLQFVFIRATVGVEKDKRFKRNWEESQVLDINRGAYHYYWANVNSTQQAKNFIKTVDLKKGDLPPVLDIEDVSSIQSIENLRKGLKNWISIIKKHYGVAPILYTGASYYKDYLSSDDYFKNYPRLWIANYSYSGQPEGDWDFWQFTDKLAVPGIKPLVDGNVYRHDENTYNKLLIN
ncbi:MULTISPECIES: glycoside hydrolase family 25 protein [Nonlabens]|uniref:glycoside hydrolase family 25 protein n=1 Tax=Nonlabens TaxID=363408 RepID=UPI000CF439D5|nr:GH25 family lysozyme [Nonlabens tegetincola]